MIFNDLIDHLLLYLSAAEKNSFDLSKCSDINPLFTKKHLRKIKSLCLLKIYVLSFVTWLDHSILNELVVASGSEDAQQLLNMFNNKIESYSNQPITLFPIPSSSQLMIPLDDSKYTLLAIKFNPPSRGDTTQGMILLQDVKNIKLILKRKWKITSQDIQLVAVYTQMELLYWMIPKCLVEVVESNMVLDWKSGIVMIAILPANFHTLQNNSEMLKGPFSSLNNVRQDDTKVAEHLISIYLLEIIANKLFNNYLAS